MILNQLMFIGNMGVGEWVVILLVVILLFGGKKIPELARGLGKGIREFKDASEGVKREIHRNINAVDIENELKEDERKEVDGIADYEKNHIEISDIRKITELQHKKA